jgi:RNA polymerase sigma factor (sigma-70 family)
VSKSDAAESRFRNAEKDEEIYRSYSPALVRYANSLVGPSDAADVVSSAVLKAFTSKDWPSVANPRAYLYKAVLNEVRSQYRANVRRKAREARAADSEAVLDPEVRPEVTEALNRLSPMQRAVSYLFYMEDLDESSVAETIGISRGSVRRHLGRAREKLRQILDE